MERYYVIVPALAPAACIILLFGYFCICSALGRQPEVQGLNRRKFSELIGPLLTAFFLWLIRPIERVLVIARVSPNVLTALSLASAVLAGVAIATAHLAMAAWAYVAAGMFDVLDGRLARATGRSSGAGAFLDSIADRWAEVFVLAGFVWFLRSSSWLLAALLALSSSLMVSYTRARGEGLGLTLDGGTMQRAERILVVTLGTFAAAVMNAAPDTRSLVPHVMGVTLSLVGLGATVTAVGRWSLGYRQLVSRAGVNPGAERIAAAEGCGPDNGGMRSPAHEGGNLERQLDSSSERPAVRVARGRGARRGVPAGDKGTR